MSIQHTPDFKSARIIDAAKYGSTISEISRQTSIPFSTVRRIIYEFENIGVIKTTKRGSRVFVRVSRQDHPIVGSMIQTARWVSSVMWDPDTFVANMFAREGIRYAFVGTTRMKYTKMESRNMVQIAVVKKYYEKAKKMIQESFGGMGIKITEDPDETVGYAMSIIYIKCFPVEDVKGETLESRSMHTDGTIKIRIADKTMDDEVINSMSERDRMFIPPQIYR